MVSGENSVQCPQNNCGPRAARDRTGHIVGIVIFDSNAYLDNRGIGGSGSAGFIPAGSTYTGNGQTVGGGIYYPDGLPSGGGRSMYDFSSHTRNPQDAMAQASAPAPLNDRERRRFDNAVNMINTRILRRDRCRQFLEDHNINPADVTATLNSHQAYSGPRSTNISVRDAGLWSPEQIQRIESLPPGGARDAGLYEMNRSVSQYFRDNNGRHGRTTQAAVAAYSSNPNSAYYRNFSPVTMLHESLHIVTGLGDTDLAVRLGLNPTGESERNSAAITRALRENGCS